MEQLELQGSALRRLRLTNDQYEQLGRVLKNWPGRLYGDEDMARILAHRRDTGHPEALPFVVTRAHIMKARDRRGLQPARTAMTDDERRALARHLGQVVPAEPVAPDLAAMPIQHLVVALMDAHTLVAGFIAELKRRARVA